MSGVRVRRYACPPAEVFGARRFVVVALRETTFDNFFFFRYGVGSYRKTIVFLFLYGHCEWKRYLEPILTLKVDKTTVLKFLFTI
jgi:hypothetical protein